MLFRQLNGTGIKGWIVIVLTIIISAGCLFAGEEAESTRPAQHQRYRVFLLKSISAEQGIDWLSEFNLGTVSCLPGSNTLLVTASSKQLVKASSIIKVVDSKENYVIKKICPADQLHRLPPAEQIAVDVGGISIGTFAVPPKGGKKSRVIIGVHKDFVVVIAAENQIEKIASVIEKLKKTGTDDTPAVVEPGKVSDSNQPAEPVQIIEPAPAEGTVPQRTAVETVEKIVPEKPAVQAVQTKPQLETPVVENKSDELFGELLSSLDEDIEKQEAKKIAKDTEPNEPKEPVEEKEPVKARPVKNVPELKLKPVKKPVVELERAEEKAVKVDKEVKKGADVSAKTAVVEEKDLAVKRKDIAAKEDKSEVDGDAAKEAEPKAAEDEKHDFRHSYEPEPIVDGNQELDLVLPEKLSIIDLLVLAGEYLKLDYMYDPAKVKGEVALKLQGKLSGKIRLRDLYPLVESVLQFQGFAMSRKGNLVTIVPKTEVLDLDPTLISAKNGRVEFGDVIVTRVFELKHIDIADAKNLLDGMKLGVNINTSISGTKTFIVTGYARRMKRIEQLLEIIDKPGKPKQYRFRQLKYTMAVNLTSKVQELAGQMGTVSISVGAGATSSSAKPLTRKRGESTAAFRKRQEAIRRRKSPTTPTPARQEAESVYLDADERTNRILMIGLAKQLDEVERLIDSLDVEKQDLRMLRLYEIQYVGADEVKEKLAELGIISSSGTTTRRTPARRRTTIKGKKPTPATTAITPEEALAGEPQVVIIEPTNSLLVNATTEQHNQIAIIIGYVDAETEVATIPYVVYPLENQDPIDLAETLNQLIRETVEDKQQDKAGKVTRTTTTTRSKMDEDITILPDEGTFSLIVYASKKNQVWIESLIKQLDKRRPQVLLDVTLVQITKDDAFNFYLDTLAAFPDSAFVSGQLLADPEEGVMSLFERIKNAPDRSKFLEFQSFSSSGNYKGFYGNEKISALFTAIQTHKYGRVMARPKLLVNDNEEGEIKTTDTTYITRLSTSIVPTSGDQSSTLTSTNFDDYTAGITLKIKPHISAGDMLRLEITLNRSGFTEPLEGLKKPPDKSDTDVSTVITVPNKSTIILGGVEKVDSSRGGDKMPLLGDIPLIGGLFRKVARADSHNKLYIFVKAYILRPGGQFALDDLREVSRKNRQTFEDLESEMGSYQDWPGVKPTPLDPLRVLEAD